MHHELIKLQMNLDIM